MNKIVAYILILIIVASCNQEEIGDDVVAKVADAYLYEKDVLNAFPENLSKEDSLVYRSSYIDKWILEQLMIKKAKLNIDKEKEGIDKLVADYQKDLLINKYKEALLQQNLDTVVTQEDIDKYYELNKQIYRLNEDLVKIKYIHFNSGINNQKELIKSFKSEDYEDLQALEEMKLNFNSSSLSDSVWVSVSDVVKRLPFLSDKKLLKKTEFLQKEDSLGVYLVALKAILKRNEVAPKSYVEPTIKQMILHNRKLELVKSIEKTLMDDATKNNEFEKFN